jgi:hypothetical protein
MGLLDNQSQEQYYLGADGNWNSNDELYGAYQFVTLNNIVDNFIVAYVGEEKIIPKAKRTDIIFHAKRAIQEFSYDVFRSSKSQEIEIPPTLNMILPQDYVGYTKLSWTDDSGIERIIYPAKDTSNPLPILQDSNYEYLFDQQNGDILTANESETWKKFKASPPRNSILENNNNFDVLAENHNGRRYGADPEKTQANGTFYIDPIKNIIHFSADLVGHVITLKYISDGLGKDEDTIAHKFAEEAIYKQIAYAILSTRANTPEYIIGRFKRERMATKRNAKLRLSNLKLNEIAQVMRGKSKQIKH